jgi:hypothetical protein
MVNQGYRLTWIGVALIAVSLVSEGRLRPLGLNILVVSGLILVIAGWYVQSSMFAMLSKEEQIRIGYALPEDFDDDNRREGLE